MAYLIEFHGRIARADGRGAAAGVTDLAFALYPEPVGGDAPLWSEMLADVSIASGGTFDVVLGQSTPLHAELFAKVPRWMSVRTSRGTRTGDEIGPRTPLLGATLRVEAALATLEARLSAAEGHSATVVPAAPLDQARRRIRLLHRRLKRIEHASGPLTPVQTELESLQKRLAHLDSEEGRITRLEDELEDLVGPDGDLIDILERIERIEGSGPVPRPAPPTPAPGSLPRMDPRFLAALAETVDGLRRRFDEAEQKRSSTAEVTADSLHAVKRSGDTMTGGLIINRGGLDVLSGGVKCRGAEVNSLEASLYVKAPKVMTESLELRGDLTVDSTRRVLQVRHVEGRAGSGRKDGALELNGRSGEPVIVGNAEQHGGIVVHGVAQADGVQARAGGLAHVFDTAEAIEPGEVAALTVKGQAARSREASQPTVVGVVVASAGWADGAPGDGRALVAHGGVVRCRVTGEVHPGDLLVASAVPGRAERWAGEGRPAPGSLLGKALGTSRGEAGEVAVLVTLG